MNLHFLSEIDGYQIHVDDDTGDYWVSDDVGVITGCPFASAEEAISATHRCIQDVPEWVV